MNEQANESGPLAFVEPIEKREHKRAELHLAARNDPQSESRSGLGSRDDRRTLYSRLSPTNGEAHVV